MSDDLVSRLHDEAMRLSGQSIDRGCVDSGIASNLADAAADALSEARAEIKRLRKVACDCASAIGNGAALSPESSLDFIELLPSEIAKHTDKLRRFLKCARDEGAEALDRAAAAEHELSTLRARVREVVGPFGKIGPFEVAFSKHGKIFRLDYNASLLDQLTFEHFRAARQLNEDVK